MQQVIVALRWVPPVAANGFVEEKTEVKREELTAKDKFRIILF